MKYRRLAVIILGAGLTTICVGLLMIGIEDKCSVLSQTECRFLYGTAIISMLGGALLVETLIRRQKARGEWRTRGLQSGGSSVPASWLWYRSVARVILVSLLAGLPVIMQGALGVTIFGTTAGMSLNTLVRGIMNWLPPIEKDTDI